MAVLWTLRFSAFGISVIWKHISHAPEVQARVLDFKILRRINAQSSSREITWNNSKSFNYVDYILTIKVWRIIGKKEKYVHSHSRTAIFASLVSLPRIECFHSRDLHLCKFIGTKESVCIRKEFNSHRNGLGHQHGRRFIVLGHQYGRRDVMWKHSIVYFVN